MWKALEQNTETLTVEHVNLTSGIESTCYREKCLTCFGEQKKVAKFLRKRHNTTSKNSLLSTEHFRVEQSYRLSSISRERKPERMTAIHTTDFIGPVEAVIVAIADPLGQNTAIVSALKLIFFALRRRLYSNTVTDSYTSISHPSTGCGKIK